MRGRSRVVYWYVAGCMSFTLLQNVVVYGSTYVLVALSIDRLDAIAQPINYLRTGQSPGPSTRRNTRIGLVIELGSASM